MAVIYSRVISTPNPNEGAHEMKIARTHLLARLALVASVSVGLAACGGSSDNNEDDTPDVPTPHTVTLPAGHGLTAGTTNIGEGETEELDSGVTLMCPEGADCVLTVSVAEVTGDITAMSTGGLVVVTVPTVVDPDADLPPLADRQEALRTASQQLDAALLALNTTSPTALQVANLNAAIAALDMAIKGAGSIDTGQERGALSYAQQAASGAQMVIDRVAKNGRIADQKGDIAAALMKVTAARQAVAGATAPDRGEIDTLIGGLNTANMELQGAIDSAVDVDPTDSELVNARAELTDSQGEATAASTRFETARNQRRGDQMEEIAEAEAFLTVALKNLDDVTATSPLVEALDSAIKMLQMAIAKGNDLTADEKSSYDTKISEAQNKLLMARADVRDNDTEDMVNQRNALASASNAVTTALNAIDDDEPTQPQVTALKNAIDSLNAEITKAKGILDANDAALILAQSAVNTAQSVHDTAQNTVTQAENAERKIVQDRANAASEKVAMAIQSHDLDATTPTLFAPVGEGDEGLRITRDSDGNAKIEIVQDAEEGDDDYMKFNSKVASGSGTTWMGSTFDYTDPDPDGDDPKQSSSVFTNIDKAGDALWTAFFLSERDGLTQAADSDSGAVVINSADADRIVAGVSIKPPAPATNAEGSTQELDNGSDEVAGKFFGVDGKFTCAGTGDCRAERDQEGKITYTGGDLTFEPDVPDGKELSDIMVKGVVPDAAYLHFGHWLESTAQSDGTYKHEIRTFTGAVGSAVNSSFDSVRGKATYSGAASGIYVKKSDFNADGDPSVIEDGNFIAGVDLTAQFGTTGTDNAGKVAANDEWSISGKISNFMDGSENLGWTLMLEKADLGSGARSSGVLPTPGASFSGETKGSAGSGEGAWSGQMWGDADAGGTPSGNDRSQPTGVTGEFNGHFTNGHVAGAFGAEKD